MANGADLVGLVVPIIDSGDYAAADISMAAGNLPSLWMNIGGTLYDIGDQWAAEKYNQKLQYYDKDNSDGVMPIDYGPVVIAQLPVGLGVDAFGPVEFGGYSTGTGLTNVLVPEPATLSLLVLGALGALLRRRRSA
jgi:hypothetical protein